MGYFNRPDLEMAYFYSEIGLKITVGTTLEKLQAPNAQLWTFKLLLPRRTSFLRPLRS